jgi:hypothetical protein
VEQVLPIAALVVLEEEPLWPLTTIESDRRAVSHILSWPRVGD